MKLFKKLWKLITGRKPKISPVLDDESLIMAKPYVDAPSHVLHLGTLDKKERR